MVRPCNVSATWRRGVAGARADQMVLVEDVWQVSHAVSREPFPRRVHGVGDPGCMKQQAGMPRSNDVVLGNVDRRGASEPFWAPAHRRTRPMRRATVGRWRGATAKRRTRRARRGADTAELWQNCHRQRDASNQRRAVRGLGRVCARAGNLREGVSIAIL